MESDTVRMLDRKSRDRKGPVRKYILRMRNRKLRNIRPSGALFTGSDSHVNVPLHEDFKGIIRSLGSNYKQYNDQKIPKE